MKTSKEDEKAAFDKEDKLQARIDFINGLSETEAFKDSPINLDIRNSTATLLPSLDWFNYEFPPKKMKVTNTGHTVIVSAKWYEERPFLAKGPMQSSYVFNQMHFHWGTSDRDGSEHTVEGKSLPLEMHVVHFKSSYATQDIALREGDGMIVIIYFFQLQPSGNGSFDGLIEGLPYICAPHTSVQVSPFALTNVLPTFADDYFIYWGCVNAVTCKHRVMWIVCREKLGISSAQLEKFRMLLSTSGEPLPRHVRKVSNQARTLFHVNADADSPKKTTLLSAVYVPRVHISRPGPGYKRKQGRKHTASLIPVDAIPSSVPVYAMAEQKAFELPFRKVSQRFHPVTLDSKVSHVQLSNSVTLESEAKNLHDYDGTKAVEMETLVREQDLTTAKFLPSRVSLLARDGEEEAQKLERETREREEMEAREAEWQTRESTSRCMRVTQIQLERNPREEEGQRSQLKVARDGEEEAHKLEPEAGEREEIKARGAEERAREAESERRLSKQKEVEAREAERDRQLSKQKEVEAREAERDRQLSKQKEVEAREAEESVCEAEFERQLREHLEMEATEAELERQLSKQKEVEAREAEERAREAKLEQELSEQEMKAREAEEWAREAKEWAVEAEREQEMSVQEMEAREAEWQTRESNSRCMRVSQVQLERDPREEEGQRSQLQGRLEVFHAATQKPSIGFKLRRPRVPLSRQLDMATQAPSMTDVYRPANALSTATVYAEDYVEDSVEDQRPEEEQRSFARWGRDAPVYRATLKNEIDWSDEKTRSARRQHVSALSCFDTKDFHMTPKGSLAPTASVRIRAVEQHQTYAMAIEGAVPFASEQRTDGAKNVVPNKLYIWDILLHFHRNVRSKTCVTLPALKFEHHFDTSGYAILTNNGTSVELRLLKTGERTPRLSGGPLSEESYILSGLVLNWLPDCDGKTHEMGAYFIHYLEGCGSADEASKIPDGLAVTAFIIEEGGEDEPYFEQIISALFVLDSPGVSTTIPREAIRFVEGSARPNGYYTFVERKTSSPLNTTVVWMLFSSPVLISKRQMKQFRKMSANYPARRTRTIPTQETTAHLSLICYAT